MRWSRGDKKFPPARLPVNPEDCATRWHDLAWWMRAREAEAVCGGAVSSRVSEVSQSEPCPEESYWRAVSEWVIATQKRYSGFSRGELTQCFMRGPFAGWSERQVAELAESMAASAERFPLGGHGDLKWRVDGGTEGASVPDAKEGGRGDKSHGETGEAGEDYCPVCQSCGEEGCCSVEKSILNHGCAYASYYARQARYDKMVIDEFHKLAEEAGIIRDETGDEVKDPIGDLYDRAWKRVEDKYGKD
jgi:hypothetical protein